MKIIYGIVVSFLFVFLIIGASALLEKKGRLDSEGTRKFIHIGVSNWWFIAMIFFQQAWSAAIVPFIFIMINALSYKKQLITSMERGGGLEDLGTVYYAVSLTLLALWTFHLKAPYIGAIGILTMGYGDGFAAVFGKKYGRHPLPFVKGKSFEGTLTMFFASFIVCFSVLTFVSLSRTSLALPWFAILGVSLLSAFTAALLEAVTPMGFDNLTVPLGVSVLIYLIV